MRHRKPLTDEQREAKRERDRRYNASPKGIAARRESDRRYSQTPEGIASARERQRRYSLTPKGIAAHQTAYARYSKSPKGIVARQAAQARYAATPERHATRATEIRVWREEHGEHPGRRAHTAVYNAVRAGRLTKQPCAVCGAVRVQAHHHLGYEPDHWLDVQWLCARDHRRAHLSTPTGR
jgi:hypothetical protein